MKRTYLGEFEEVVLLTVAVLSESAYGVAITDELERQTGRSVSISAVHAALHRRDAQLADGGGHRRARRQTETAFFRYGTGEQGAARHSGRT